MTLPKNIVHALRGLHSDIGWAIVQLVERRRRAAPSRGPARDAELVEIAHGQFLIVINSAVFRFLPGVQMVPLSENQAFLALDPGQGMSDLELAVLDRLDHLKTPGRERRAVEKLRDQLRRWRQDRHLSIHSRSIIIVAKAPRRRAA
jgi:hypothetical protein